MLKGQFVFKLDTVPGNYWPKIIFGKNGDKISSRFWWRGRPWSVDSCPIKVMNVNLIPVVIFRGVEKGGFGISAQVYGLAQ